MKFNLDKNIEYCKAMMPKWYDILVFVLFLLIGAFAKDFELKYVMAVCGLFVFYELTYWCIWLLHALICAIVKIVRDKRKNKEANDENK